MKCHVSLDAFHMGRRISVADHRGRTGASLSDDAGRRFTFKKTRPRRYVFGHATLVAGAGLDFRPHFLSRQYRLEWNT